MKLIRPVLILVACLPVTTRIVRVDQQAGTEVDKIALECVCLLP